MVAIDTPKQFADQFSMKINGQPDARATSWPPELKNQISFAALLIEKGADVNAVQVAGVKSTPIMLALDNKNYPLADLLLSKGAVLDSVSGDVGRTQNAVDVAIRQKDLELLKYLFSKGGKLSPAKDFGIPSLSIAVQGNNIEMVDFLLKEGADINEKCSFSYGEQTPIFFALRPGNFLPMAKYLVEHGADVNAVSGYGTPLHEAVGHKADIEIIKYLIEKGADVSVKEARGDKLTVLQLACKYGYRDAAKLLAQSVAKVLPYETACY